MIRRNPGFAPPDRQCLGIRPNVDNEDGALPPCHCLVSVLRRWRESWFVPSSISARGDVCFLLGVPFNYPHSYALAYQ